MCSVSAHTLRVCATYTRVRCVSAQCTRTYAAQVRGLLTPSAAPTCAAQTSKHLRCLLVCAAQVGAAQVSAQSTHSCSIRAHTMRTSAAHKCVRSTLLQHTRAYAAHFCSASERMLQDWSPSATNVATYVHIRSTSTHRTRKYPAQMCNVHTYALHKYARYAQLSPHLKIKDDDGHAQVRRSFTFLENRRLSQRAARRRSFVQHRVYTPTHVAHKCAKLHAEGRRRLSAHKITE